MSQITNGLEKIKKISVDNCEILQLIIKTLKKKIQGRRKVMYSDIINLIIREGYIGETYSALILWCNYKIRLGEIYLK
jgi:hypothetical protein